MEYLILALLAYHIYSQNKINKFIMATLPQFQTALAKIDEATSKAGNALIAIADRIGKLEEAVKAQGLTEEQENAILAQTEGLGANLTATAEALAEIGKTPETPVPSPVPDPLPPVEETPSEGDENVTL